MLLQNLVGSSVVAIRRTYPDLPVEPEGAFLTMLSDHIATERYDPTLVPYIFDQVNKAAGDNDATLSVMMYLLAPVAFARKAEELGVTL